MNLLTRIKLAIMAMGIALSVSPKISADDIFKGVRGPTTWQVDTRLIYSKNELGTKTVNETTTIKYWDGDKFGLYRFFICPIRYTETKGTSSAGVSDITSCLGFRGRVGNFHWLSYFGPTWPTGEYKIKPALGNGRLDFRAGLQGTYLFSPYEFDFLVERSFTGENPLGVNPPDETYLGILAGGEIAKGARAGAGLTGLFRDDGDYLLNLRSVLRYTVSPTLHFEFVGDIGVKSENIPQSNSLGIYIRYNF